MINVDFLKTLGVVDLISEKHKQLRHNMMSTIDEQCDDHFSSIEVFLISLVAFKPMSVSETARYMAISRQAAHKHVKQLINLGYIELTTSESNRRDKIVTPTEKGLLLSKQFNAIKQQKEAKLEALIGTQDYQVIKAIFEKNWDIT
ncbi:MarR family winged helix-turn-helix transcriptional regulator [Shewanella youngdeokensis]|uniref:MarR family winged helix-turn-helix transcriptional regulator n=1 Tax=Shewanella youngdeokensis TaxID=2999068 RepID=A0ABZ0K4G6_9GAMM|nr:MarR family winged helix-turn-helix transcriptional regulator [Shewanella sp. DAU334]